MGRDLAPAATAAKETSEPQAAVAQAPAAAGLTPATALALQRSHGNAVVTRLARRALARTGLEGEGGERGIRIPAGTQLYSKPDPKAKAGDPTAFAMPVGLIGIEQSRIYTDRKRGWFYTRIYWAVNIGGQRLYIQYEDVADTVNETIAADRAAYGPDPTLGNSSDGGFRAKLLEQLGQWVGGDIKSDPRPKKVLETSAEFQALMSTDELAKQRAKDSNFTTCIEFLTRTFGKAAAASGVKVETGALGSDAKAKATLHGHGMGTKKGSATGRFAWHEAKAGMTARPKPGDVYVLYMNNNRDVFSHIGFVVKAPLSAAPADKPHKTLHGKDPTQPAGTELWMTVDGGQGMRSTKSEAFEARYRWYDPATNEIEGEPIQGNISKDKRRWLLGWIDIEQLVNIDAAAQTTAGPAAAAGD